MTGSRYAEITRTMTADSGKGIAGPVSDTDLGGTMTSTPSGPHEPHRIWDGTVEEVTDPAMIPRESAPVTRGPVTRSYDPLSLAQPRPAPHPSGALEPYAPAHGQYSGPPQHPTYVYTYGTRKSVTVAFFLTFFFGVFGMFYSTVGGALILLAIGLVIGLVATILVAVISVVTMGLGTVLFSLVPLLGVPIWITSIIWGCLAASSHNERLHSQATRAAQMHGAPPLYQAPRSW